jgi:hypothetical protein
LIEHVVSKNLRKIVHSEHRCSCSSEPCSHARGRLRGRAQLPLPRPKPCDMEERRRNTPGPPHLWPLLLSLSLITLLRHHVSNITTALPDMPTSRQSHALPLPQPTRTVSWAPLDTTCAPSPAYKRPPFLPEKTHTIPRTSPDMLLSLISLPIELAGAGRAPRAPRIPGDSDATPTCRRSRAAETDSLRRRDTPPSPPILSASRPIVMQFPPSSVSLFSVTRTKTTRSYHFV